MDGKCEQLIRERAGELGLVLKEKQISLFVQGHDTFMPLPTGYGKSIIYALLPSVFDEKVIISS